MPDPQNTQDGTPAASASSGTPAGTTAATSPHQNPGASTSGASTAAPSGQPAAQPQGQSQGAGTPAGQGPAAGSGSSAEDRSNWHPPHVNRRLSRENAELKRKYEQTQQQLAAITGIAPQRSEPSLPDGVTPQAVQAYRDDFLIAFPQFKPLVGLSEEQIGTVLELIKLHPELVAERQVGSQRFNMTMSRAFDEAVRHEFGDNVPAEDVADLGMAFQGLLLRDDEAYDRYIQGDLSLVSEFVGKQKQRFDRYSTGRASAATTAASTTVVRNRNLPRSGASSAVVPAGQPSELALDPKDPEAIHKRAWRRMQQRQNATQAAA